MIHFYHYRFLLLFFVFASKDSVFTNGNENVITTATTEIEISPEGEILKKTPPSLPLQNSLNDSSADNVKVNDDSVKHIDSGDIATEAAALVEKLKLKLLESERLNNQTSTENLSLKKEIDEMRKILQDLRTENGVLESKLKKTQESLSQAQSDISSQVQKIDSIQKEKQMVEQSQSSALSKLDNAVSNYARLDKKYKKLELEIEQIHSENLKSYCNMTYIQSDISHALKKAKENTEEYARIAKEESHRNLGLLREKSEPILKDMMVKSLDFHQVEVVPRLEIMQKDLKEKYYTHLEPQIQHIQNQYEIHAAEHVDEFLGQIKTLYDLHVKQFVELKVKPALQSMYKQSKKFVKSKSAIVAMYIKLFVLAHQNDENKDQIVQFLQQIVLPKVEAIYRYPGAFVDSLLKTIVSCGVLYMFKRQIKTVVFFPLKIIGFGFLKRVLKIIFLSVMGWVLVQIATPFFDNNM